jgi:hypothetical protein
LVSARYLLGGGENIGQVGMTITASRRRADGDEHRLGATDGGGQIRRKGEPSGGDIFLHQLVETRLVDRHTALMQGSQLGAINLYHRDVGAELGEAGPRNQADIASANHRNTHGRKSPYAGEAAGKARSYSGFQSSVVLLYQTAE